jgi:hypothetical protein
VFNVEDDPCFDFVPVQLWRLEEHTLEEVDPGADCAKTRRELILNFERREKTENPRRCLA